MVGMATQTKITVEELREASRSFRRGTCGADGLHPRQVQWLSDAALATLTELYRVAEIFGRLPTSAQMLPARLLPKPSGGHRCIVLYGSLYRIWGLSLIPNLRCRRTYPLLTSRARYIEK